MSQRPLDGVLVVALEQAVAGPVASCRLADAGARVIKLERAEGDFARRYDTAAAGQSAYFGWANRGKESLAVNIKESDDVALIKRILAKADVFLQNLALGASGRVGLGSAELREEFPHLITCDISGYGDTGPYKDMKAYDLLVQAEAGLISISSAPDRLSRVGVSVCDIATGISASLAITEALLARTRTGVGSAIKLSLFDVLAEWMSVPLLQHEGGVDSARNIGLAHPTICPYGGFTSADGHTIVISIQNEREWSNLVNHVLRRPELLDNATYATNESRLAQRSHVDGLVQEVFGSLSRTELINRLNEGRIAFGSVNDLDQFASHPHLRRWTIRSETGEFTVPAHPDANREISMDDTEIPSLDAQGPSIRQEFAS